MECQRFVKKTTCKATTAEGAAQECACEMQNGLNGRRTIGKPSSTCAVPLVGPGETCSSGVWMEDRGNLREEMVAGL